MIVVIENFPSSCVNGDLLFQLTQSWLNSYPMKAGKLNCFQNWNCQLRQSFNIEYYLMGNGNFKICTYFSGVIVSVWIGYMHIQVYRSCLRSCDLKLFCMTLIPGENICSTPSRYTQLSDRHEQTGNFNWKYEIQFSRPPYPPTDPIFQGYFYTDLYTYRQARKTEPNLGSSGLTCPWATLLLTLKANQCNFGIKPWFLSTVPKDWDLKSTPFS